jgi:putative nucleotidyltransferase with HDIG domain
MTPTPHTVSISHPLLARIGQVADRDGIAVFVVGGYVRDLLLGKESRDIDILVMGDGIAFARLVAAEMGNPAVVAYERFGTAMVPLPSGKVEFVGARKEKYSASSRKPDVTPGTLEDDLRRRDFTVNAIAVALNGDRPGTLLDPFEGMCHLGEKILRTPLDPAETFDDDPLRMLRALRFAAQLEFSVDPGVLLAIGQMKDRVRIVSQERVTEELLKILGTRRPSIGLKLMQETGMLRVVLPEIADMAGVDQRRDFHHKDVFLHTCIVVDNVAQVRENLWLRLAALVHDIAKPRTKAYQEGVGWTFHGHEELGARMMKKFFHRLRLPLVHLPYVEKLVRLHLRPMVLVDEIVTDSAVRRLLFEAGEAMDDLMALCRADITSKNPTLVSRYLRNYDLVMQKMQEVEEKDRWRSWQPPVRGEEIMAVCGLAEGPRVGVLKKAVEDAILDGKVANEHDAALAYLLGVKDDLLANIPENYRKGPQRSQNDETLGDEKTSN